MVVTREVEVSKYACVYSHHADFQNAIKMSIFVHFSSGFLICFAMLIYIYIY